MHILAISGSLRAASSNTVLLRAAAAMAPAGVTVELYEHLDALPHFNPDLEDSNPPTVLHFRSRLQAADGVLISSPEYAHGVPGVLKNALDWIVGSGEFMSKPVALLNASAVATHAHASLAETITVMDARLIHKACMRIPIFDKRLDPAGIVAHPELSATLRTALATFVGAINAS